MHLQLHGYTKYPHMPTNFLSFFSLSVVRCASYICFRECVWVYRNHKKRNIYVVKKGLWFSFNFEVIFISQLKHFAIFMEYIFKRWNYNLSHILYMFLRYCLHLTLYFLSFIKDGYRCMKERELCVVNSMVKSHQ
jgi:hypothetical protein